MVRKSGDKSITKVWIFCEGEKTENYYFKQLRAELRAKKVKIHVNTSENKDAEGLLDYIVSFKNNRRDVLPEDLVFCVFDCDNNSKNSLEKMQKRAKECNIHLIFSNPCFEFWILSHFELYLNQISKSLLMKKLDQALNPYQKNDPDLYIKTKNNLNVAIGNSKRILQIHRDNNVNIISIDSNPLTLVFGLVEEIYSFKS